MVNSRGLWITSSILLILVLANSYYIYSLNGQVSALRDEIGELSRVGRVLSFSSSAQLEHNHCREVNTDRGGLK